MNFMKSRGYKTLSEIKREHIIKVLDETQWDFKKASEILNVSESYLRKEIKYLKGLTGLGQSKKKSLPY